MTGRHEQWLRTMREATGDPKRPASSYIFPTQSAGQQPMTSEAVARAFIQTVDLKDRRGKRRKRVVFTLGQITAQVAGRACCHLPGQLCPING